MHYWSWIIGGGIVLLVGLLAVAPKLLERIVPRA